MDTHCSTPPRRRRHPTDLMIGPVCATSGSAAISACRTFASESLALAPGAQLRSAGRSVVHEPGRRGHSHFGCDTPEGLECGLVAWKAVTSATIAHGAVIRVLAPETLYKYSAGDPE